MGTIALILMFAISAIICGKVFEFVFLANKAEKPMCSCLEIMGDDDSCPIHGRGK